MRGMKYVGMALLVLLAIPVRSMDYGLERDALSERERTHNYYVGCCTLVTGVVSLSAGIGCGLFLGQVKGYALASAVPFAIVAGGVCTVVGCFARSCAREDDRRIEVVGESRYGSVVL